MSCRRERENSSRDSRSFRATEKQNIPIKIQPEVMTVNRKRSFYSLGRDFAEWSVVASEGLRGFEFRSVHSRCKFGNRRPDVSQSAPDARCCPEALPSEKENSSNNNDAALC